LIWVENGYASDKRAFCIGFWLEISVDEISSQHRAWFIGSYSA